MSSIKLTGMEKGQTLPLMVLAGILCAGLTILPHFYPSFFTLCLFYFSFVPLFAVGLGLGLLPLYGAVGVTAVIIFFGSSLLEVSQFFFQALLGPVFLVNRALLHRKDKAGHTVWYPSSRLLMALLGAMGGMLLFALGVYVYIIKGQDVHTYVHQLLTSMDPQGKMEAAVPILIKIIPFFPGALALSWGAMTALNGVVAQGILVRFKKNLRPTPSLEEAKLHPAVSLVFIGCCLVSWFGGEDVSVLGINVACVMAFPLFLIGVSFCHRWIYKTSLRTPFLILFYLLLCFIWPALFVLVLGILKPWIEKFL